MLVASPLLAYGDEVFSAEKISHKNIWHERFLRRMGKRRQLCAGGK